MKEEYIIINKTQIEKRIEELENKLLELEVKYKECYKKENEAATQILLKERYFYWKEHKISFLNEIALLKRFLSQSTPLTPEVEKIKDNLFQKLRYWREDIHSEDELYDLIDEELDNHISNLKQ